MRRESGSIDGFVPRRGPSSGGLFNESPLKSFETTPVTEKTPEHESAPYFERATATTQSAVFAATPSRGVSRQEIDESLRDINDEGGRRVPERKKGFFKRKTTIHESSKRKTWIKRVSIAIVIIGLLVGGWVAITAMMASNKILQGNLFDIFQNKPLEMDANGRSNILIFGTSGSIGDKKHDGADLTDTIMVLSIDQKKKDAFMVSLPRDLYVKYGDLCSEGASGRINSLYQCYTGEGGEEAEAEGAKKLQEKVGEITGLQMQYYAHINWAVVVGTIDAIGGVTINVEGNGSCAGFGMPEGSVVDVNMDVRYKPGNHQMSGEEALRFSRARGSAGGCGLSRGDYDRQANQQKVLKAMREKAVSAETLTNVGKVTSLLDTMGNNLKTDFETSEVQTLTSLGREIPSDKIVSVDLVSEENALIGGDMINGASVQIPTAGTYDYSEIISHIQKTINASAITKEAANIALFNGSGAAGYAAKRAQALESRGFTIVAVDNAPEGAYQAVEIYDLTENKPATKKKLEEFYKTTAKKTVSPIDVTADTDFVIIYGQATSAD